MLTTFQSVVQVAMATLLTVATAFGCGSKSMESDTPDTVVSASDAAVTDTSMDSDTVVPDATTNETDMEPEMPDPEVAVIDTNKGRIVIELYEDDAPKTVANFKKLINDGFYRNEARTFHRYVAGFVIQGGDPNGDGTGGPGYTVPAEIKRKHTLGAVATARLGDNMNPRRESSGSQYYICLQPLAQLDGAYTVFGQVIQGMEVVLQLRQGDKMLDTRLMPKSEAIKP